MKRIITTLCAAALIFSLTTQKVHADISEISAAGPTAISPAVFTTPGKVNLLLPMSGGRMLVGGQFVSLGGQAAPQSLAVLQNDGTLDRSFQVDVDVQITEVIAAAVQSDGKVVIGGVFKLPPSPFTYYLLRLNSDGSLDDTFYLYTLNGMVKSLLIDGTRILVGGNFSNPTANIARLDSTGHTDTTFNGVGTGPNGGVKGIGRQSNGKYIIVGDFASVNGTSQAGLARLNTNGSLDAAFVPGGFQASEKVAVLNDSSVVVGGTDPCGDTVFRWYTSAGEVKTPTGADPNFLDAITALLPLPDGGFLLGGWNASVCIQGSPTTHEGQVWRYAANGAYQTMTTFGNESDILALGLRSDGKALAGGQGRPVSAATLGTFDGLALLDLANSGLGVVNSFRPQVGDDAKITSLSRYADGRLLVAGDFSHVNGQPRFGLARLLADRSLDPTFHPFGDQPGGYSQAALALPDGRAVAGFDKMTGSRLYLIAANGSLTDLSSNNNYDRVSALARQSDGKVLVGSDFGLGVRRLKADFSGLDLTFHGGDAYGGVYSLAVQADGKILVGGDFTQYDGAAVPGLVRLRNDSGNNGLIDGTFVPPIFLTDVDNAGTISIVLPLSGGKVLTGGYFAKAGGSARPSLVRLNSNGSVDTAFTSPTIYRKVTSLCTQTDGSIWVGGVEEIFALNPLLRHYTANGGLDTAFQSSFVTPQGDGSVNSLLCATDGLDWAGGRFNLIDTRPYYGLVRYVLFDNIIYLPLATR